MLYRVNTSLPLLIYYIKTNYPTEEYEIIRDEKILSNKIKSFCLSKSILIGQVSKIDLPEKCHRRVFVIGKGKGGIPLEIKITDLVSELQVNKKMFTPEALLWFISRYKDFPNKLIGELEMWKLRVASKPITKEELTLYYTGSKQIENYVNLIGKGASHASLINMSESEIWALFIGGGKGPPIERYVSEEFMWYLSHVTELVKNGLLNIKLGIILFNKWFLETTLSNTKKLTISKEKLNKLYEYIYE